MTGRSNLIKDEIITGRDVPVVEGDMIPFFGTMFRVAGTMEPTGMKFFDSSVFMSMEDAYKMAAESRTKSMQPLDIPQDKISAVLVQVKEGYTPERVSIRIEHDVPGVKAIASDDVITTVRTQMKGILRGIFGVSIILWLMALIMMGFAFYMIVNERQREIGVLRAMGAGKTDIISLIMIEAITISFLGGIIGIILGGAILLTFKKLLLHYLRLPYLTPSTIVLLEFVLLAIVFSVLTGFISSLLPDFNAVRMEPYEAIRKGE